MFVINFIVVLLSLNDISSNLVQEIKIRSVFIFIAQKLIFFIICYKRENFDSDFGHFFSQTRV